MRPLSKRIIAIAAAFGEEQKAEILYESNAHFRALCDDLQELIEFREMLPNGQQSCQPMPDCDQLIAELVGELRQYLKRSRLD